MGQAQGQLRRQPGAHRLRWAVLASLILHLLLLWPEVPRPPAREAAVPLRATVRIAEAPVAPMAAAPQSPPRARPAAPVIPVTPSPSFESPAALQVPRPVAGAPELAAVAPGAPPTAAAAVPGAVVDRPARTAGIAVPASPATGDALDGLRAYRLSVATQARRFKRYPVEAQAAGASGSAEVRLEVGVDGTPRPATVARSSGHAALDRAALAMIDAGAARARLPDGLRGREFAVLLPVMFDLDER